MSEIKRPDMNRDEARATCEILRSGFDQVYGLVQDIRKLVLDLHDRKGWVALGYKTWRECVEAEFIAGYRQVNRELQAARIEQELEQEVADGKGQNVPTHQESPMESGRLNSAQLLALASVEPGKRREVIEEVKAASPKGKVTAKGLRETAAKKPGRRTGPPVAVATTSTPRSEFKSIVNGEYAPDIDRVAALRATGKIDASVVVEVELPEPDSDAEANAPDEDPPESEDEWLARLPLTAVLADVPLKIFQSDALRYFRMKAARDSVRHHNGVAGKGLRKDGEYAWRIAGFLKLANPRDWIRCAATDYGGCGGAGYTHVGPCRKCHGRGYTIDNRRATED